MHYKPKYIQGAATQNNKVYNIWIATNPTFSYCIKDIIYISKNYDMCSREHTQNVWVFFVIIYLSVNVLSIMTVLM